MPESFDNAKDPEPVTFHIPVITDEMRRKVDNVLLETGSFMETLHEAARLVTRVENYEMGIIGQDGKETETIVITGGNDLALYGEDAFLTEWYNFLHDNAGVTTEETKKSASSAGSSTARTRNQTAKNAKKKAGRKKKAVSRKRKAASPS